MREASTVDRPRYIDENDLPFTEDELFRAFALTEDEQVARNAAHTLAELLSSGTYEGGWSIGYEGFAALACCRTTCGSALTR
jgi:cytosine/adenosine deaminase-related metal-dependent hydrolase